MQRISLPFGAVLAIVAITMALAGCGGGSGISTGVTDASFASTTQTLDASVASPRANAQVAVAATPAASSGGDASAVIVGYKKAPGKDDDAHLSRFRAIAKHKFELIPAVAADLTPAQVTELRKDPNVAYVESDAIAHATADAVNWDMTSVSATKVWPTNTGAGVRIAVIDTGIDYHHADLAPNYAGGYNFVKKTNDPLDDHGHGTHVAGTIAAAVNGSGIKGVAPAAKLYALKVLDASGSGSYSNIIAALQWCVTNKMQIASMSLGASVNSKALHDACTNAYQGGVLLVAAAGNSGTSGGLDTTVEFPAAYGACIAVGAVDSNSVRPYWSSTGAKVELAAPGVNITSDKLGGGLTVMSGTSMATPHVAGVAALVYASGVAKPALVRQRLDATASDLGAPGRDNLYGYGLVNASAAVSGTAVAMR